MRSILARVGAVLLASALLTALFALPAWAAEETFTADLTGAAEVPSGDEDGSGTATITIDVQAGTLCYEIEVADIEPATASHIHVGAAGVAGDVVIALDVDGFEGSTSGCIEPMEDAQALQDITDDPAGYYVNVHTEDFPGGAVRGQLVADMTTPTDDASPSPSTVPDAAMDEPAVGTLSLVLPLAVLLLASAGALWVVRRRSFER